ncbi:MAG TPA: hypothetical protein P5150_03835 [Candidatus Ratteibacteria bacterium]|nr:hypothetical protein [Candidatus Ratteibacteria bacterium]
MELHYQDSWVSEVYQGISLSKNVLHQLLEDSCSDVLLYLSKYRKVKIPTHWLDLEIPKQTKKLIENLDLHIT